MQRVVAAIRMTSTSGRFFLMGFNPFEAEDTGIDC